MIMIRITDKYSPLEAFLFDFFVSPAVAATVGPFRDAVLDGLPHGSRVLDIGCGGGQLAVDLGLARGDIYITGLDLSLSQARRARRRGAQAQAGVHVIQASALGLPFRDSSFDLVYSVDCLKHWPDREAGLRECLRVLRPGGTLLITEIDRASTFLNGLRFVSFWNVPAVVRPLSVVPFFLFAVWRSLTMEEARALVAPLPIEDVFIGPENSGVNWTLKAKKPFPHAPGGCTRDHARCG